MRKQGLLGIIVLVVSSGVSCGIQDLETERSARNTTSNSENSFDGSLDQNLYSSDLESAASSSQIYNVSFGLTGKAKQPNFVKKYCKLVDFWGNPLKGGGDYRKKKIQGGAARAELNYKFKNVKKFFAAVSKSNKEDAKKNRKKPNSCLQRIADDAARRYKNTKADMEAGLFSKVDHVNPARWNKAIFYTDNLNNSGRPYSHPNYDPNRHCRGEWLGHSCEFFSLCSDYKSIASGVLGYAFSPENDLLDQNNPRDVDMLAGYYCGARAERAAKGQDLTGHIGPYHATERNIFGVARYGDGTGFYAIWGTK